MSMTLERFRDLVDRHGPNKALWPASEKAAAEDFLLSSEGARAVLADALVVDEALRAVPKNVRAPEGLLDRICEAIKDQETSDIQGH